MGWEIAAVALGVTALVSALVGAALIGARTARSLIADTLATVPDEVHEHLKKVQREFVALEEYVDDVLGRVERKRASAAASASRAAGKGGALPAPKPVDRSPEQRRADILHGRNR